MRLIPAFLLATRHPPLISQLSYTDQKTPAVVRVKIGQTVRSHWTADDVSALERVFTTQKSHYPPGNNHASHF